LKTAVALTGLALVVGGAVAGTSLPGCKCQSGAPAAASASASARPAPLPPLSAPSWLVELPVEGFESAAVAVPLGAIEPRPVLIALHGGADRPEWQCGTWVGIARSRPFVLCPRGIAVANHPNPPRYTWASSEQVQKELRAALKALKAKYRAHVAPGPVVLAGYGAGTRPAVDIARQEPSFFSRLVLVSPEDDLITAGWAGLYARAGGQRALFVCSSANCRSTAERYALFVRGARVDARLLDIGDRGGLLDHPVAKEIAGEFTWLVAGDPGYPFASPPGPAPSASNDGG